tara:strand:- start:5418 stop:6434 length:1017 start_codon:yes stop_codon:yes gene_type:complete
MKSLLAPTGAILSIVALIAWLFLSEPPGGSDRGAQSIDAYLTDLEQERAGGSAVPCAVPLTWRIATVDDRFGITAEQASVAVQRAAELWELAIGLDLFSNDATAGLPISFVYDDRQENIEKQRGLEKEFEEDGRRLNRERSELRDRRAQYVDSETAYRERVEEFYRLASDHNATVRDWNERGGAPEAILQGLMRVEEKLQEERRELNEHEQELEGLRTSLLDGDERLRRELDEHRGRGVELERMFPLTRVEAGLYLETVQRQNGRVVAIQRGIDIYRFDSFDDLQFLVAHELGHALGLGHSTVLGALMSAEHDGGGPFTGRGVQPGDVELLRSRCPEL